MCDCGIFSWSAAGCNKAESASLSDKTMLEVAKILLVNHTNERQMFQSTCWAKFCKNGLICKEQETLA